MIFSSKTVFSQEIRKPEKVKKQLNKLKGLKNYWLVIFRPNINRPEIYQSIQLKLKLFSTDEFEVLGVFTDENEAFEFIRELTDTSVTLFGMIDYRKAFDMQGEGI